MAQHDLMQSQASARPARKIPTPLVSGILWLISVGSTVMAIFATREIILWGLAIALAKPNPTIGERQQISALISVASQCGIILFGILGMGVILYGGEQVFHHAHQPRTVRWLARLIAIEVIIILPIALLIWRT